METISGFDKFQIVLSGSQNILEGLPSSSTCVSKLGICQLHLSDGHLAEEKILSYFALLLVCVCVCVCVPSKNPLELSFIQNTKNIFKETEWNLLLRKHPR